MGNVERRVWREARAMTRREVITKAIAGQLSWVQASEILAVSARHMRRLRRKVECWGMSAVMDQRGGRPRRKRIKAGTIEFLCRLKRDLYPDFSLRHFYEQVTERHGVKVSYNWLRLMLQEAGVVEKEPARGKYRRQRERRPMVGMLVHLDASTHLWIPGLPRQDLVVALDDADGRILYARFFPQEGTASTFAALDSLVRNYGRFCELYTDRGSHFCQNGPAGELAEEQHGQVSQALRALGIRQILARSPQARGRSERAFGTIQGRLPQELRHHGITDYEAANRYLAQHFIADFNRRFMVQPAQPESAFVKLAGIELELVLSAREERVVRNDNTVGFHNLILQLPPSRHRAHFVRCPVTVHQFSDGHLGISYQGRLLARYDSGGELLHPTTAPNKVRAASAQPPGQPTNAVPAAASHWRTRSRLSHFSARTPQASEGAGGKMSISQTANSTPGGDSPCPP